MNRLESVNLFGICARLGECNRYELEVAKWI